MDSVRSYIGEVCPVPMSATFPYAQQVADLLDSDSALMSQAVTINGDLQPVHRQYGTSIKFSGDKFDHLFHEDRFNRWCVGEVHILAPHIVPNGRRDYFEPGPHLRNFENHLGPFFRGLSNRCRKSLASRNKEKRLLESLSLLEDIHDLATAGYLGPDAATGLVRDALQREQTIRDKPASGDVSRAHVERLDEAKERFGSFMPPKLAAGYADMTAAEVKAYHRAFQEAVTATPSLGTAKRIIENVLRGTQDAQC